MESDDSRTNEDADNHQKGQRRTRDMRRIRLLAVACFRRALWELLIPLREPRIELILSGIEQFGDCQKRSVLRAARKQALDLISEVSQPPQLSSVLATLLLLTEEAMPSMTLVLCDVRALYRQAGQSFQQIEGQYNRDVFHPHGRAEYMLGERSKTVSDLALAAYKHSACNGELDRDRLQVLSDALEDAGAEAELLTHLRSHEPHIRGCWVLDLVLGL